MKKRVFGRQLSRERDTRRALFRSLIRALVEHGKINTTKAKAKAIQADIDKLVNLAKKDSISAKRRIFAILGNDKETTKKLLKEVVPSFSDRSGGYTRIVPLPARRGDAAQIVRFEWVKEIEVKKTKATKEKTTKTVKKKESKSTKKK
ncbi:50S ribosomal protein L17 [Candidatus Woesebacteria bacterium]|nr:MAG: 50S ribosomal protein L17 [Candidatus Woesebacteria bacterium]